MAPEPQAARDADWMSNTIIALCASMLGIAFVLFGVGQLAGLIATGSWPEHEGVGTVTAIVGNLGDPAAAWPEDSGVPDPTVFWTVAGICTAILAGAVLGVFRLMRRGRSAPSAQRRRVHAIEGLADRSEIQRWAGPKALAARADTVRPSLANEGKVPLEAAGQRIGQARGVPVWTSVEDSVLILGPPRSGKGLHLVIAAVLDAPGAVVTTSTRPDTLAVTLRARERVGPVAVFDPQGLSGLGSALRWSPIRGCEDPRAAQVRATALAASTGMTAGSVRNADFWAGQTRDVLQALLHAAAIDGVGVDVLYRWSMDPAAAEDAVQILTTSSIAADGWDDALRGVLRSPHESRGSVWMGVRGALAPLGDPTVRAAMSPGIGEQLDPAELMAERGSLFLLGTAQGAAASAGMLAALVEDITETARRLAARSRGARLDPPVRLVLDEIAQLSPLPSLPGLMADGGGSGINTWVVLQSLSQARDKWGQDAAGAMWEASITKIILGGGSAAKDLEEVSKLIGERDETTISVGRGHDGHRNSNSSLRRVAVLPPEVLRSLPFGTALVLQRATRPIMCDLEPWPQRRDGKLLATDRAGVEEEIVSAPVA